MRLIDAEKMRAEAVEPCKFCHLNGSKYCREKCEINALMKLIDNAPTVEERPHGKWLIDGHSTLYHVCSNCGGAGDHYDYFCRICGADMKGGAE